MFRYIALTACIFSAYCFRVALVCFNRSILNTCFFLYCFKWCVVFFYKSPAISVPNSCIFTLLKGSYYQYSAFVSITVLLICHDNVV